MKSCKKASYLISKELDVPLNSKEKLALMLHLVMCKKCANCKQQLHSIHQLCQQRHARQPPD